MVSLVFVDEWLFCFSEMLFCHELLKIQINEWKGVVSPVGAGHCSILPSASLGLFYLIWINPQSKNIEKESVIWKIICDSYSISQWLFPLTFLKNSRLKTSKKKKTQWNKFPMQYIYNTSTYIRLINILLIISTKLLVDFYPEKYRELIMHVCLHEFEYLDFCHA